MRKLFNLFKKSEPAPQQSDLIKPAEYYDINGKRFAIADRMNIKVQASASFKIKLKCISQRGKQIFNQLKNKK